MSGGAIARQSLSAPKIFYVYEHVRPDTGAAFYVGKGCGNRAWRWAKRNNQWHRYIIEKLGKIGVEPEVRIIFETESEKEAFSFEKDLITLYKSIGHELCNLSYGGEGPSGRKHTDEWKLAISKKLKGRKLSEKTIEKIRKFHLGKKWALGYKKTPEQIEKTRLALKGKKKTPEHISKMSYAQKRRTSDAMVRSTMSERAKERFRDPLERLKISIATRNACSDPEIKKRTIEAARKRMSGEEGKAIRKKISDKNCKKVVCKETGDIFPRPLMAAQFFNVSENTIYRVIKNKCKIKSGFSFSYVESAA